MIDIGINDKTRLKYEIFEYTHSDYTYRSCEQTELARRILLLESCHRLIKERNELFLIFLGFDGHYSLDKVPKKESITFYNFIYELKKTLESYRGVFRGRFDKTLRLKSSDIKNTFEKILELISKEKKQ